MLFSHKTWLFSSRDVFFCRLQRFLLPALQLHNSPITINKAEDKHAHSPFLHARRTCQTHFHHWPLTNVSGSSIMRQHSGPSKVLLTEYVQREFHSLPNYHLVNTSPEEDVSFSQIAQPLQFIRPTQHNLLNHPDRLHLTQLLLHQHHPLLNTHHAQNGKSKTPQSFLIKPTFNHLQFSSGHPRLGK